MLYIPKIDDYLPLFRMSIFGAAHGWGGEGEGKKASSSVKFFKHI